MIHQAKQKGENYETQNDCEYCFPESCCARQLDAEKKQ